MQQQQLEQEQKRCQQHAVHAEALVQAHLLQKKRDEGRQGLGPPPSRAQLKKTRRKLSKLYHKVALNP